MLQQNDPKNREVRDSRDPNSRTDPLSDQAAASSNNYLRESIIANLDPIQRPSAPPLNPPPFNPAAIIPAPHSLQLDGDSSSELLAIYLKEKLPAATAPNMPTIVKDQVAGFTERYDSSEYAEAGMSPRGEIDRQGVENRENLIRPIHNPAIRTKFEVNFQDENGQDFVFKAIKLIQITKSLILSDDFSTDASEDSNEKNKLISKQSIYVAKDVYAHGYFHEDHIDNEEEMKVKKGWIVRNVTNAMKDIIINSAYQDNLSKSDVIKILAFFYNHDNLNYIDYKIESDDLQRYSEFINNCSKLTVDNLMLSESTLDGSNEFIGITLKNFFVSTSFIQKIEQFFDPVTNLVPDQEHRAAYNELSRYRALSVTALIITKEHNIQLSAIQEESSDSQTLQQSQEPSTQPSAQLLQQFDVMSLSPAARGGRGHGN